MRFLFAGIVAILLSAPVGHAAAEPEKVTAKTTEKVTDYPALCRMAEANRDWASAWGFAEKWAASTEPEVRRAGVVKLLELALRRESPDYEKLTKAAADAGLTPVEMTFWRSRVALKKNRFQEAEALLTPLIAGGELSHEQLAGALRLQTLALLGLKRYAAAAEASERRRSLVDTDAELFDAACYRAYALALDGKTAESQALLTSLASAYPKYAGELADLEMLLAVRRGDLADLLRRFGAAEPRDPARPGSEWYFSACREGASLAESGGDRPAAVRLRRAALRAAETEGDRRQAVLDLLATLDRFGMWKELAETIRLYLEWYPDVPDRTRLELQAARYLVRAGDIRGALAAYDAILARKDRGADPGPAAVALEAARQCGALSLADDERKYLQYALRHAETPETRQEAFFRMGEHHDRAGADQAALDAFRLASSTQGPLAEESRFRQLVTLLKMKDYQAAQHVAESLRQAKRPEIRAAALYHIASLYEKTGRPDQAAAEYQAFAKTFPKSEFAASALYNAALIAEAVGDPAETARRFAAFLDHSPKHELAQNALYKLFLAQSRVGDPARARATAERLAVEFPDSPFTAAALFALADRACEENRCPDALEYLSRIEKMSTKLSGVMARVLFDRASIYAKLDNPRKALELLDKLLAAHASDPVAADAAELAGFLHSRLGDYAAGSAAYLRAAQLRPGGAFAAECLERRADGLFLLASAAENPEQIRQAEQEYRILLQKNVRPYAPLLFKIGRCLEAVSDAAGARRVYAELLYRAAAERQQGIRPDPVWCPKALYAAIRLDRARRNLDGARGALRLIQLARESGLVQGGELDTVEREIRAKYKL